MNSNLGRMSIMTALAGMLCLVSMAEDSAPEAERVQALAVLKNVELPVVERRAAAARLYRPNSEEKEVLIRTVRDPEEDEELRFTALDALKQDMDAVRLATQILKNPRDGSAEFKVKLIQLITRTFRLPAGSAPLRDLYSALRDLLYDPRETLRHQAFLILVPADDPLAVDLLVRGLQNPDEARLATHHALGILNFSGSLKYLPVFRPYLDSEDPKILTTAVAALAYDPQNRPRVAEIARNRETPQVVRIAALRRLRISDDRFPQYALAMVQDEEEDVQVRKEAAIGMIQRMNNHRAEEAEQIEFYRTAQELAGREVEELQPLVEVVKSVLPVMHKRYPAIKDLYWKDKKRQEASARAVEVQEKTALLRDKEQKIVDRLRVVPFLSIHDANFRTVAQEIIIDPEDDLQVRRKLLDRLIRNLSSRNSTALEQVEFAKFLEALAGSEPPADLKADARRFTPWLRKKFPAVEAYYDELEQRQKPDSD